MSEQRPVEHIPQVRSTFALWASVLAGPVLWLVHFMVVYLGAEAACTAEEQANMVFIGPDALVAGTVAATVVAVGACLVAARWASGRARRGEGDEAALGRAGTLTAIGGAVAILAVGLPALVVGPC